MFRTDIPEDGVPASKSNFRANWRALWNALTGKIKISPLLGAFNEVISRPAVQEGVVVLDLDAARVFVVQVSEQIDTLDLVGTLSEDRSSTFTLKLVGDGAHAVPALDQFVWVSSRPDETGGRIFMSAITLDGGVTWEAFAA